MFLLNFDSSHTELSDKFVYQMARHLHVYKWRDICMFMQKLRFHSNVYNIHCCKELT